MSDSTFNVKTCSFYKLLQTALSNPVFMRDGGVLGFNSHYSYVFDMQWADLLAPINTTKDKANIIQRLNRISGSILVRISILKGADYIVVESAKSLGLPICVKPFLSPEICQDDSDFKYALKDFSQSFAKNDDILDEEYDEKHTYLQMFGDATCRYKPQDITWCQELSRGQAAGAAVHYGNEASLKLWYKSAAILIRIPKWSEYRQRLISTGDGSDEMPQTSKTHEDETVKDFKDVIEDYEDIVQEETKQLLDQVKKLLDNKCFDEVQGLKDKLKKIKNILKANRHVKCSSEQIDNLCRIKDDLSSLKYYVKSKSPYKLDDLLYTVSRLRSDTLQLSHKKHQTYS